MGSRVSVILFFGTVTQVLLPVIEAVVVYMVAKKMLRSIYDKPVHINIFRLFIPFDGSYGISGRFRRFVTPPEL